MKRLQIRGKNTPPDSLLAREPYVNTDTGDLYIGTDSGIVQVTNSGELADRVTIVEAGKLDKSDTSVARKNITGEIIGNITGTSKGFNEPVSLSITGDATGSASFSSPGLVMVNVEIDGDKHTHPSNRITDMPPTLYRQAGKILRVKNDESGYELSNESFDSSELYTKNQIDTMLNFKAAVSHNHNSLYYTESEIDGFLLQKSNIEHNHDSKYSDINHKHAEYAKINEIQQLVVDATVAKDNALISEGNALSSSQYAELQAFYAGQNAQLSADKASESAQSAQTATTKRDETVLVGNQVLDTIGYAQDILDYLVAMGPRGICNVDGGHASSTYLVIQNLNGGDAFGTRLPTL